MKFQAKVVPSGNATAVVVPATVMQALGSEGRPLVVVSINGHTRRSRVALMRGQCLIGISAANRAASGIAEADLIQVTLEPDTEPRVVPEPPDLAAALDKIPEARSAFARLPFGLKRKHVTAIENAKSPETRQRRVLKLVADLRQSAA